MPDAGFVRMLASSGYTAVEPLRHDKDLVLVRGQRPDMSRVLIESTLRADADPRVVQKLERGFALGEELDPSWTLRQLGRDRIQDRLCLLFEDPGGDPLSRLLVKPRTLTDSLRLALQMASALGKLHARNIIHKDIKPENVWVDAAGTVRLMGFGLASRLPRERQEPGPPEVIAGSLPYMSPEQTGRMNRSIDSRSDLYSLGVTLYELFTGVLPFEARDPIEWIHCHVARPVRPPHERNQQVPPQLSALVLKLLAKSADERYQTALGVRSDLERCVDAWEAAGRIDEFPLGVRDVPARLVLPEKLYGRASEGRMLLEAFGRVASNGLLELVCVSGYSGIGKSSLVNELQRVLVRPKGLLASGKFDAQRRGQPYFIFAQAFQKLLGKILAASADEVLHWRTVILTRLGTDGRVMTDLIPELELVIGEQPPVPALSLVEARNRFHGLFVEFVSAFAGPEHPLVLFLDDLQWLDGASLSLLEHIATHPDLSHLLLVGAYRDNEVGPEHPLRQTIDHVRATKTRVTELHLAPLAAKDTLELVAEALHCSPLEAGPLAECVQAKTGGNPFFTIQFMRFLEDEPLIEFDAERATWSWDLDRIREQSVTANVAELVVEKLERLPAETRRALQRMACLGSSTDSTTLGRILGSDEDDVRSVLWPALLAGMLTSSGDAFRFSHDRVQEAAYSLIPAPERALAHSELGRLLLRGLSEPASRDSAFLIADQFNRGLNQFSDREEERSVRRLNANAGHKATLSAAYGSASAYFARALALLPASAWETDYDETRLLYLEAAESDFMAEQPERAESLLGEALERARTTHDKCEIFVRRAKLQRVIGHYAEALELCLEGLRLLGVAFPPVSDLTAIGAAIGAGMARVGAALRGRTIPELADARSATDLDARAISALLAEMLGPAYHAKSPYVALIAFEGTATALEHGPATGSPMLYMVYAYFLAGVGDVDAAKQFADMALRLDARVGDEVAHVDIQISYGTLAVWWTPFALCVEMLEKAFHAHVRIGNLSGAGDCAMTALLARIESGEPLGRVIEVAEQYLAFARRSGVETVYCAIRLFHQFLKSFQDANVSDAERPAEDGVGGWDRTDEARILATYEANGFTAGFAIFHILKQFWAFTFGRADQALLHSREAERHVTNVLFTLQERNQPFFQSLAAAALHDSAPLEQRAELVHLVSAALDPLAKMAEHGPRNFADRLALVQAELARLQGRDQEAMRLYDKAIASARENGLLHRESLANEVASRFYERRGFNTIAQAYLRNARACYLRWGATRKVRQLDRLHPALAEPPSIGDPTIGVPLQDLDLLAVVQASQAVSGEIVLERFIEKLLRLMVESAGAERAALIRPQDDGFVVEAEAEANPAGIAVRLLDESTADRFPESMLRFAVRTRERVLLDDATAASSYADDAYVIAEHPRSVLVLPLLKQSTIVAVLYLENRLATRLFAPNQLALVQILASQAAISLENARLYRSLERAEQRFSKAFRNSPMPMGIFRIRDEVALDANDAFVGTYGFTRDEFLGRTLHQLKLIDPVEGKRLATLAAEKGVLTEEEASVRNRQGKPLSLLVSLESIDLDGEACALVTHLDVTTRKQMESQLRQSQKMDAIGRLAGGVAHDFNNLLTVINGFGSLMLQDMDASDVNYESLQEILKAGERAAALTTQLLAHSRMQAHDAKPWNLNPIVTNMVPMLTRLIGEDIRLEKQLTPELSLAKLDRGQVEQVLLNLVVNARDALRTDGQIIIHTANIDGAQPGATLDVASGPQVMLSVSDNGSGMTSDVKSKLFEPFFTTKPPGRGTGLGLSVVYAIVKQSGGSISVDSEEGVGSVFRIYFPAVPPKSSAAPNIVPLDSASVRGEERILVVEDAEAVRKFTATALRAQGYAVLEAENGVAALRVLAGDPDVRLIVTDVVMPDMDGAELARRVRTLHPALPILFVSGFAERAKVRQLLGASEGRLLQKPFSPSELARRVREALEAPPAELH